MRLSRVIWILGLLLLLAAAAAWAYPNFVKTFADTYKVSKDSAIGKAACAICHTSVSKGDKLNPYGVDLQKAMKAEKSAKLTGAILKKIESSDSDKDGAKNIHEIKGGTLPGDAKSKPAAPCH